MNYERLQKLLKEIDCYLGEMECKRKDGKWVFHCRVSTNRNTNNFGHFLNAIKPLEEREYEHDSIGFLWHTDTSPNKVIKEIFRKLTTYKIAISEAGVIYKEKPTYNIGWNGKKFVETGITYKHMEEDTPYQTREEAMRF